MKKNLLLTLLVLFSSLPFAGFAQLLYQNNTSAGYIYNPGLGTDSKPKIVFDDINIPSSVVGGSDSIAITLLKVAIGRAANAPAVTVKIYISKIDTSATSYDSLLSIPLLFLTSFDLPANGQSTILAVGDSINPFYTIKPDSGFINTGYQTLFVGVSFSTSDNSNGWIFSTGPGFSDDVAWEFDSLNTEPRSAFNFGGPPNPDASFYTSVYGKLVSGGPLPLALKDFNVTKRNNQNLLSWKTETENNTSYFTIEHSQNGRSFKSIGQITAAGYSNSLLNYQFSDDAPLKGINYYRLHCVDKDNKGTYSAIKSVRNNDAATFSISPNPIMNTMKLVINADKADKATLSINDLSGKQVYSNSVSLVTDSNTFNIDLSNIPKGAYTIRVKLSDDTFVKKFSKL
ncbi:MAG: T9SS type A sorting domain-containing protein [Ginsengibacter sp.]